MFKFIDSHKTNSMEPIESAHTINTDFYTSEKWNKNANDEDKTQFSDTKN